MLDATERLVVLCLTILAAELIGLGAWAGVRVTEADRNFRTDAVEACTTLDDQGRRLNCIREVG